MRQPQVRCVEFVEEITEWLEDGLSDDQRLLFEEHLAYCSPCDRYVAQFRMVLAAARDSHLVLSEGPPPAVRAALLDAFRHRND